MNELLKNADLVRLAAFAGGLALFALLEAAWPRRPRAISRWRRWPANLLLVAFNSLAVRLLLPFTALTTAFIVQQRGIGVLPALGLPDWLQVVLAVVALDLVIYAQHVAFHKVPALWRLHRVHHTDLELDVTTGTRFHFIEIVLSMLIKMAAVAALGAPPLAVLLFEVLLNLTAMFNHSNLRLPQAADRLLRLVLVTPDFHRVHHSVLREETDSNYGFNLSLWDRLFTTYRPQPRAGHLGMTIGLPQWRDIRTLNFVRLLTLPFEEPPEPEKSEETT
ncbi:MAG: sterol desaturase family protein [Gammaproteobacteria bacterium]|nr:MAG: sterol desaturase family protein [Gammaproteobacteria bacterium]